MKKCSKCGAKMIADKSQVLTSHPPQYIYKCPKCGNTECGFCSEDDPTEEAETNETVKDTTNWNAIRNCSAMLAMVGLILNPDVLLTPKNICREAVFYADELVEELNKR